jgi:DNA-binding CsgD family transcriptional regulator
VRTRRAVPRGSAGVATDREVSVVAAVLDAGSEKAAAHRLGLSHSTVKHHLANARSKVGARTTAELVWILATRLPEPQGGVRAEKSVLGGGQRAARVRQLSVDAPSPRLPVRKS